MEEAYGYKQRALRETIFRDSVTEPPQRDTFAIPEHTANTIYESLEGHEYEVSFLPVDKLREGNFGRGVHVAILEDASEALRGQKISFRNGVSLIRAEINGAWMDHALVFDENKYSPSLVENFIKEGGQVVQQLNESQDVLVPAKTLDESMAVPRAAWDLVREMIREVSSEIPTDPDEHAVAQEVKTNYAKMSEFVQSVPYEASKDDVKKVISILADELNISESVVESILNDDLEDRLNEERIYIFQETLKMLWAASKAAYNTFVTRMGIASGIAVPTTQLFGLTIPGFVVPAWAMVLLLATIAFLATQASIGALRYLTVDLAHKVYRKWRFDYIKFTRVIWPKGNPSLLPYIEEGEEYRFRRDVATLDAYHPAEAPMVLPRGIPFEFKGFVSPRFWKEHFMLIVPTATKLAGDERIVSLNFIYNMENLHGVSIQQMQKEGR